MQDPIMKAAFIEEFAQNGNLQIGDLPKPSPMDGEVCIAVKAAGVNPADGKIAQGLFQSRMPHKFPLILGWEAAGTIESLGKGVQGWKVGDKVFTYCKKPTLQHGAWAEFVTVSATDIARIPHNLTFEQAAGIPLAGLTAWQALFEKVHLQPKETVLIHGGAGGVGSYAIQWAKNKKAHVITTATDEKAAYVKKLGADEVIDYQKHSFVDILHRTHPAGIDVVFDTIGKETYLKSFEVLKKGGRIVSLIEQPNQPLAQSKSVEAEYLFVHPDGKCLHEMALLFEKGAAQLPQIDVLSLDQAEEALTKIRTGRTVGKIVLRVH